MGRQHTNRGALLTSNLPQLQNLIKRDPISYRDEFLQQWAHFQSIQRIWKLQPTANTNATGNTSFGGSGAADRDAEGQHFRELVSFIAQVAQCYPNETKDFPNELALMLHENYASLTPELRRSFMQNLVMLRNKDVIGSIE
jgi:protein SDA1